MSNRNGVKNNDPNLPSCKTVIIQGQRGMRIKGIVNGKVANSKCKVRNIADRDGNVKTYSKQNQVKKKVKETASKHMVFVSHNNRRIEMLYDTGAEMTTMRRSLANFLGITQTGLYQSSPGNVRGAGNDITPGRYYENVPLRLEATGEVARSQVFVSDNVMNLLGTGHIKQYKQYRIKFR